MTVNPKWAHLPNASHIDRILSLSTANAAWADPQRSQWHDWNHELQSSVLNNIQTGRSWRSFEFYSKDIGDSWSPAWYALLALVYFDDCAYMLDSDVGELGILAAFGDQRAILLLPACKILGNHHRINTTS